MTLAEGIGLVVNPDYSRYDLLICLFYLVKITGYRRFDPN